MPGFYRHYKSGDVYQVLGTVLHTETDKTMVLYRAVHPNKKARERNPRDYAFVRPTEMFIGIVQHKGVRVHRFQRTVVQTSVADARTRDGLRSTKVDK